LVGLHGILVGAGEIVGGLAFGILGKHLARFGRHYPVILGFVVHMGAYVIAFVNLPANSPIEETNESAYIEPNPYLAIFGSFLLGLGDACYNTQIYSLIGSVFKDESAAGFAIYKFFQSAFAAAAFFYSNVIDLPYQLIALGVLAVLGTICFCTVELRTRSRGSYDNAADLNSGSTPTNPDEDNSCGIVSSPVTTTSDDVRA